LLLFTAVLISLHIVKTIRNIFSYLLVLLFLVPATGFYYTRHSCLKSGEVQLVLDGDYTCCAETTRISQKTVKQEGSCCDLESDSQVNTGSECSMERSSTTSCVNEGNYLKSENEYTLPGKIEMPQVKMLIAAAHLYIELLPVIHRTIEENAHSPPFILSSADILHKHSVLII
jgi:hypothetical protein